MNNYKLFYFLLKKVPNGLSKEEWVRQFTKDRTEHLHEMRPMEYSAMVRCLQDLLKGKEESDAFYAELRRRRSAVLILMQKYGIDTTDWSAVDALCRHPRISGKDFKRLNMDELATVAIKLRTILRKTAAAEKAKGGCQLEIVKASKPL